MRALGLWVLCGALVVAACGDDGKNHRHSVNEAERDGNFSPLAQPKAGLVLLDVTADMTKTSVSGWTLMKTGVLRKRG